MAQETLSEKLCRSLSSKNFLKEFVFRDLFFCKDGKSKNEVCDCLIEFLDVYIIIEVKERSGGAEKKDYDKTWLEKKVYKKAISQLKRAIQIIQNQESIIAMNDYGRKFTPKSCKSIIPMVVFLNPEITEYHKVHCSQGVSGLNINIFSMSDFEKVLKTIIIPYDIVNYLLIRSNYIKEKFPELIFDKMSATNICFARIGSEEGFIKNYNFMQDKSLQNQNEILNSFIFICNNMRSRLTYGGENYLQILYRLICFDRKCAICFVERWSKSVELTALGIQENGMHIVISYYSLGILYLINIKEKDKIRLLFNLFKRKFNLDTVICVIFNEHKHSNYVVEWIMAEGFAYEESFLDGKLKEYDPWEKSVKY